MAKAAKSKAVIKATPIAQLVGTMFSSQRDAEEACERSVGKRWTSKLHVTGSKAEGYTVAKGATKAASNPTTAPKAPALPGTTDKAKKPAKGAPPLPGATEETTKVKKDVRNKSTVDNPVAYVWEYCNAHKGESRKEIIAHFDAVGIAYHTARTQYQWWKKAGKVEVTK